MRWKDNFYFYLSVALLIFCFVLIFHFYDKKFDFAGFIDVKTILGVGGTVFGAYFGAKTAGKYATRSVEKQIQYDRNNRRQETLTKNLKINVSFLSKLGTYNEFLKNNLDRLWESQEEVSDQDVFEFNVFKKNSEISFKELISIPLDDIPYEYYRIYLAVTKIVEASDVKLSYIGETLKITNEKAKILRYVSSLRTLLVKLENHYKELRQIESEQEAEFEKLKHYHK